MSSARALPRAPFRRARAGPPAPPGARDVCARARARPCAERPLPSSDQRARLRLRALWRALRRVDREDSALTLFVTVLLAEAIHATGGVDQLLLARIERVALAADVGMDLRLRRARLERVAARALDGGGVVLGMNAGFHLEPLVAGVSPEVWDRPNLTLHTVRIELGNIYGVP